jgi:hypothetical protein
MPTSRQKQKTIIVHNVSKYHNKPNGMQKAKKPMKKEDIYCKIELIKDKTTGKMMLTTHLNPQAPNVITDEHTVSWTPTFEEQHFLIDAISLIKEQQHQPLVTFTKKDKQQSLGKNERTNPETIDSINRTIDNLPFAKIDINNRQHATETIENIIKQNAKEH